MGSADDETAPASAALLLSVSDPDVADTASAEELSSAKAPSAEEADAAALPADADILSIAKADAAALSAAERDAAALSAAAEAAAMLSVSAAEAAVLCEAVAADPPALPQALIPAAAPSRPARRIPIVLFLKCILCFPPFLYSCIPV